MSRVVRKPALCICENKDADQLISVFAFATRIQQSLLFQNTKFQASSHISVTAQPGLYRTRSETPKTSFHTTMLMLDRFMSTGFLPTCLFTKRLHLRIIIFVFVCIIRDADFHFDLYGLPAIVGMRKFFFHFVFSFQKIRRCRLLLALRFQV